MSRIINLRGQKFGRLSVVGLISSSRRGSFWDCLCICGNHVFTWGYNLRNGHSKSCGCARADALRITATTHGMYGHRFYNIYRQILRRCNEPNHKAFKNYGGRGIKNEWQSFEDFKKDMFRSYNLHLKKFGEKNNTIDRIDVEGNYSRENCRWATWKVQANNKRK